MLYPKEFKDYCNCHYNFWHFFLTVNFIYFILFFTVNVYINSKNWSPYHQDLDMSVWTLGNCEFTIFRHLLHF